MPKKIDNILVWASDIEDATIEQARKTASLPFLSGHLALMPDAHVGFGSTVGSVIPTKGAIIPSAVGVDIGCGMIAVETGYKAEHLPESLEGVLSLIEAGVPAGVGKGHDHHSKDRRWLNLVSDATDAGVSPTLEPNLFNKAAEQFGTLGSGNHFVEVCLDERDVVWVVLHSGSRGVGNVLATKHIDGAKGLMKSYFIELEDPDLAYLVEGTAEFNAYIRSMMWAQEYAMANRDVMMDTVLEALDADMPGDLVEKQRINCHHNYTARENHHGQNVWLTRKGAIRARSGDKGVIPGSMGTRSYIVSGLGNPASYESCSHGAGRRLSRGAATRTLDVASFETAMKGVTWQSNHAVALLDEHPDAYKDIDQVMEDQKDLVAIEHTLHQVLNYKGTDGGRKKRR